MKRAGPAARGSPVAPDDATRPASTTIGVPSNDRTPHAMDASRRDKIIKSISFLLAGCALLLILAVHLLVPFLAGLLVYELVISFTPARSATECMTATSRSPT